MSGFNFTTSCKKETGPSRLVVVRRSKEIMVDLEFESAFKALEHARNFYKKSDTANIKISLLGAPFFDYTPERK